MTGIYIIINPKNKIYIGQTNNFIRRLNEYKRLHCKAQRKVYYSLMKYGFECHKIKMIHKCNEDDLNDLERYYQDLYQCIGKYGLNLKLANSKTRSGKLSQYVKDKISKSNMGKIMSDEARKNMSLGGKGKKSGRKGIKMSDVIKKKISDSKKGQPPWNIGIKRTDSEKLKMSNNRKGKMTGEDNHNSKLIINTQTGIFLFGIKEAAKSFDGNYHSMRDRLNGKTKNKTDFLCLN
jgi:group I intron endonuclease